MSFAPRQEDDRVRSRRVAAVAIGCVAIAVIGVAVSGAILEARRGPVAAAHTVVAPGQISMIEQSLVADTKRGIDLKAKQREALGKYGFIDASRERARIPIDRAIDLLVERGE